MKANSVIPLLLVLVAAEVLAQGDPVSRSWNQPVDPFRIAGNLYYVGASDVTSFLITTREGHILIDGGFEETAPKISAHLPRLGFEIEDAGALVTSYALYPYAGGVAAPEHVAGHILYSRERHAPLCE